MIVGIPKEIKDHEYRVGMTPGGVHELAAAGHRVLLERGAGEGSGFPDSHYQAVGATVVSTSTEAWQAELVVKVKEPQPSEYAHLRPDLALFTFLHLAADEQLTHELVNRGTLGIAYETVELASGYLPLLTPMSEVAGRLAIQASAYYLEQHHGGRGKLMGGVAGVRPADVVIIGAGIVGTNAARVALGMGANVILIDRDLDRLRQLEQVLGGRLNTLSSNTLNITRSVERADVLVGAVLLKGARAPRLVTREMIGSMTAGSVVVDVAIDQGGCIETARPTTHSDPVYLVDGVIHYCVANMPAAVPRTSTYALSNATLPYVIKLANEGTSGALQGDPALAKGVNTCGGAVTYPAVAEAFALPYTPLAECI